MATALASRFAVLPDDVDDEYSKTRKRPPVKKQENIKPTVTVTTKSDSKKKKNKENSQSQNGKTKKPNHSNNSNAGTSKKKKEATSEQWEEWKQKDSQMMDGSYENQLSEAILLSKLDYEEKKEYYDHVAKASETDKKTGKKNKKTIRVLSVEEFHNLGKTKPRENLLPSADLNREASIEGSEFFDKIRDVVKKEIIRENTTPKKTVRVFSEEALTVAQLRDALDKKVLENTELQGENLRLKEELLNVKTRNKKLCQILANGEMKDKAEVLIEVERLQGVRDELSQEIDNLYVQLEQERSKVRSLTSEKSKEKNKKRTTSSGES